MDFNISGLVTREDELVRIEESLLRKAKPGSFLNLEWNHLGFFYFCVVGGPQAKPFLAWGFSKFVRI